jgi:hypothetical protein
MRAFSAFYDQMLHDMTNRELILAALAAWPDHLPPDHLALDEHDPTGIWLISGLHRQAVQLVEPTTVDAVAKARARMKQLGALAKTSAD